MQQTDFKFDVLFRDDASTDGTAEICHEYAKKYPELFKLLAYKENQWVKRVKAFFDNVKRAQGKHIAMCEGDDYWTDPLKLQKQVEFFG
jgi:glycosyltransferase involved in cell wall biosynthesis